MGCENRSARWVGSFSDLSEFSATRESTLWWTVLPSNQTTDAGPVLRAVLLGWAASGVHVRTPSGLQLQIKSCHHLGSTTQVIADLGFTTEKHFKPSQPKASRRRSLLDVFLTGYDQKLMAGAALRRGRHTQEHGCGHLGGICTLLSLS